MRHLLESHALVRVVLAALLVFPGSAVTREPLPPCWCSLWSLRSSLGPEWALSGVWAVSLWASASSARPLPRVSPLSKNGWHDTSRRYRRYSGTS
jgi:hypothetical protein